MAMIVAMGRSDESDRVASREATIDNMPTTCFAFLLFYCLEARDDLQLHY